MKNPVKKIVVKKQYSILEIKFFWSPLLSLQLLNLENFGSNGKIKEFDNTPNGAWMRKFPYARPDAAPLKLEEKNISIK